MSNDRRLLLSVGRLSQEKGFDQLITAFALIAERCVEWDLVILGEGEDRNRLEAQCRHYGLGDRVYLPGRAGNVGDWYHRADLYVLSSLFEGFPNTLAEAMAHGLPAVSFDCATGPAEIIRDGRDGLLVPPEDGAEGLASMLHELMRNEYKRQEMANAAVDVRERYSSSLVMAAWNEALGLDASRTCLRVPEELSE